MKEFRSMLIFLLGIGLIVLFFSFVKPGSANEPPLQRPSAAVELPDGRLAVADAGGLLWNSSGSKVMIVDRLKKITWIYRGNLKDVRGLSLAGKGDLLIADSGGDRILQVDKNKNHVWTSENWGRNWGKLPDGSHLSYPVSAYLSGGGKYLISDSGNGRIIEADRSGKISRTYTGLTNQAGIVPSADGGILICDPAGSRVFEINRSNETVWKMDRGLNAPEYAMGAYDGTVLIADTGNDRVILVTRGGRIIREIRGMLNRPASAIVLKNGNILVCDTGHARLLELNVSNSVVWEFRNLNNVVVREQLTNGSTETVVSKKAPGWNVCDLSARGDGKWLIDNQTARDGSNSLSLKSPSVKTGKMFWGQLVRAVPGTKAELSVSVKALLTDGYAGIGFYFLDDLFGKIGETNVVINNMVSDWKTLELKARVPVGAASLYVVLVMQGAGQSWFDDVRLTAK